MTRSAHEEHWIPLLQRGRRHVRDELTQKYSAAACASTSAPSSTAIVHGQHAQRRRRTHAKERERFLVDAHRKRLGGTIRTAAGGQIDDVEFAQRPERVQDRGAAPPTARIPGQVM